MVGKKKKKKNIADGKMENKNFMRCPQTKCNYFTKGGCKKCATCDSDPYVIKKSCPDCNSCFREPGFVRWDNEKDKEEQLSHLLPEGVSEEEFLLKALKEAIDKRLEHIEDGKEQEPEIIFENDQTYDI